MEDYFFLMLKLQFVQAAGVLVLYLIQALIDLSTTNYYNHRVETCISVCSFGENFF